MALAKLLRCPRLNKTLELYIDHFSNKLLETFKEVAKFSEFSLNYLLDQKFDDEILAILLIHGPLMKDMALTSMTALLASDKSAFELYEAPDLADSLDRCNLYPTSDVKQALQTLEHLVSLGIISVPTIILDTYKEYKKANQNSEAHEIEMTDEEIKNSLVFNRILGNIYKNTSVKFYSALSYCLANSQLNEKYFMNELWSCKTLMLVLFYGLMKHDFVLSVSTMQLFVNIKDSDRLETIDYINLLWKTKIFKADDIKKVKDYVKLLKNSGLVEFPADVDDFLSIDLSPLPTSRPKPNRAKSPSPTTGDLERALTKVLTDRGDLSANPQASVEFLGEVIEAGYAKLKGSTTSTPADGSSSTKQRVRISKSLFYKFEKILKKQMQDYKGNDPFICSLIEDDKATKLKKLKKCD